MKGISMVNHKFEKALIRDSGSTSRFNMHLTLSLIRAFLWEFAMKDYTSKELKDIIQVSSDKKKNILMNWIDSEAKLSFRLPAGTELLGKLKFFTRYDYVVHLDGQPTISILAKHAVLWIDRV